MGAALGRRPGNEILEVDPQPTFVAADLAAIGAALISRSRVDSAQVARGLRTTQNPVHAATI